MSTPALNVVIWLSVKPIIKLALPAAAGFALTRSDMFPVSGSRAASQIILNVTLPSLLFSKIVPSFNSTNISAFGPSDLPTSVVATVTLSAPFNGAEDSNLAIAYVAMYVAIAG
ncbi:hypothetical protein RQP46_005518 [Phenoliferia psychrophenolica]